MLAASPSLADRAYCLSQCTFALAFDPKRGKPTFDALWTSGGPARQSDLKPSGG